MCIKKFEAFVGDDGLKDFEFKGKVTNTLVDFMDRNSDQLRNNGISIYPSDDNEFYGLIKDDNFVSIGISKVGNDILFDYNLDNGDRGELTIKDATDDDIFKGIFRYLGTSNKLVGKGEFKDPRIDITDADQNHFASENEEDAFEKKSKEKVGLTTPDSSIKMNKGFNVKTAPDKHKDSNPWYSNVKSKRIEIGSKNPVKDFKEWNSKYWRRSGEEKLKYEPNSGIPEHEEITKPLKDMDSSSDFVDIGDTVKNFKNWSGK